jgi:hypothetical protein
MLTLEEDDGIHKGSAKINLKYDVYIVLLCKQVNAMPI